MLGHQERCLGNEVIISQFNLVEELLNIDIGLLPEHALLLEELEKAPAKLCASVVPPVTADAQELY